MPAADWTALADDLRAALGADAVRFDTAHRAAYASEASNYRQVPIGVVVPRSIDQVVAAAAVCRRHGAPILMRGAGTSMNGQCVNVAVVFDLSQHCRAIVELNPAGRYAIVEPGIVCDSLRDAAEAHGLTFAPDPATHSRCTLGGMIGNNSCGAHSVMAGKTLENVEALEVLTYEGERFWCGPTSDAELEAIIAAGGGRGRLYAELKRLRNEYADRVRARFPDIKRRVSGYNLDQLLPENGFNVARALVGSEGTCALVLQARVTLVKSPPKRVLLVLGFPDIYLAGDAAPEFLACGPIAIEGLDRQIIRGLQARGLRKDEIALLPEGDAWVVLEFGAESVEDATAQAERAAVAFANRTAGPRPSSRLVVDPALQGRIWLVRETGASATSLSITPGEPDPVVGWEDAAVDPPQLGHYLRAFQALVDRMGYRTSLYGHFGDGCVHARITFDLRSAEGLLKWREFTREAAELVVKFGGSLSGEHGDGQAKGEFLPIMYGPELMQALRDFKRAWDPRGLMNPRKLIDAYRIDENLRAGPAYKVVNLQTTLAFRSAEGDGFQRQVERCIGMGRCRQGSGSTMCPSYRGSGEERWSTRGRARLLWEMLQGELVPDGWRSEPVKEALDTCLSCKGCRSDCPTHTDMAAYKAEFLSHYHEGRRRPRQAFTFGRIGDWAPWAARFPWLVNLATQTPGLSHLARWAGGVAPSRSLPRFARKRFRALPAPAAPVGAPPVLLWVDTFCEHFHPEVAQAAREVLGHAGFRVQLPDEGLCCGRPLYDFGLLDQAKDRLARLLAVLAPAIDKGTPLVGLEPGCLSVFKDELLKLFPDDRRAQALAKNTFLLGDFLLAQGYAPPPLAAEVLVHGHCHQKALFGVASDMALLKAMGAKATLLDSGCCGMAGSFGMQPQHAGLSQRIGELVLLPAVRQAAPDAVVLSNGFSCREQIRQGTGREPVHLAELLARAHRAAASASS